MALDKTRLAQGIITNLKALNSDIAGANEALLVPYWEAISDAIITEITDNLEVTTEVTVPGVQSGSSTVMGTGQQTDVS